MAVGMSIRTSSCRHLQIPKHASRLARHTRCCAPRSHHTHRTTACVACFAEPTHSTSRHRASCQALSHTDRRSSRTHQLTQLTPRVRARHTQRCAPAPIIQACHCIACVLRLAQHTREPKWHHTISIRPTVGMPRCTRSWWQLHPSEAASLLWHLHTHSCAPCPCHTARRCAYVPWLREATHRTTRHLPARRALLCAHHTTIRNRQIVQHTSWILARLASRCAPHPSHTARHTAHMTSLAHCTPSIVWHIVHCTRVAVRMS